MADTVLSFDDLVPAADGQSSAPALTFDDLIPKAPAATPKPSAIPATSVGSSRSGGAPPPPVSPSASRDVTDVRPSSRDVSKSWTPTSPSAYATQRLQQVVTGAANATALVPEGIEALRRGIVIDRKDSAEAVVQPLLAEKATLEGIIEKYQPGMDSGDWEAKARVQAATTRLSQVNGQLQMAGWMIPEAKAQLAIPIENSPGFRAAKGIREFISGVAGTPDYRDTSFGGKVATGAGSIVPTIAATLAGTAVGAPELGLLAGGFQGSMTGAGYFYNDAIKGGASEEDAAKAAKWGAAVGLTEILPVGRVFEIIPGPLKAKIANKLVARILKIGENAGEEGLQEWGAQVAQNLEASGFLPGSSGYDPEREWDEGAIEALLIGGIIGGGMGAVTGGSRAEPKVDTSPTGVDAATQSALNGATAEPKYSRRQQKRITATERSIEVYTEFLNEDTADLAKLDEDIAAYGTSEVPADILESRAKTAARIKATEARIAAAKSTLPKVTVTPEVTDEQKLALNDPVATGETASKKLVVNDPGNPAKGIPASSFNGTEVTLDTDQTGLQPNTVRVVDEAGNKTVVSKDILTDPAAPKDKTLGDIVRETARRRTEDAAAKAGATPPSTEAPAPTEEAPVTSEVKTPETEGDTLPTVPESEDTIAAQNKALLDPKNPRKAVFIPYGNDHGEAPTGATVVMIPTNEGILYLNTKKGLGVKGAQTLLAKGQLGQVLGLGTFTKADVAKSAAKGKKQTVVTERTPEGVEVKAAAGTIETAPTQLKELDAIKGEGNTVQVEDPAKVLAERLAQNQATETPVDEAQAAADALATNQTEPVAEPTISEADRLKAEAEARAEKTRQLKEARLAAGTPTTKPVAEPKPAVETKPKQTAAEKKAATEAAKAEKARLAEEKKAADKAEETAAYVQNIYTDEKTGVKMASVLYGKKRIPLNRMAKPEDIAQWEANDKKPVEPPAKVEPAPTEKAPDVEKASLTLEEREKAYEAEMLKEQEAKDKLAEAAEEAKFARDRANSGGFKTATEEAEARWPKNSHKGAKEKAAYIARAEKGEAVAKATLPSAEEQGSVKDLEGLKARFERTLAAARDAKLRLGTQVSDVTTNAVAWIMQTRSAYEKIERLETLVGEKDSSKTIKQIMAELNAFLEAERAYIEGGNTTEIRDIRAIEGEEGGRAGASKGEPSGEATESQIVDENIMSAEDILAEKQALEVSKPQKLTEVQRKAEAARLARQAPDETLPDFTAGKERTATVEVKKPRVINKPGAKGETAKVVSRADVTPQVTAPKVKIASKPAEKPRTTYTPAPKANAKPAAKSAPKPIEKPEGVVTVHRAQRKGSEGVGVGESAYGIGRYWASAVEVATRYKDIVIPVKITGPKGTAEINLRDAINDRPKMLAALTKAGLGVSEREAIVRTLSGEENVALPEGVKLEVGDSEIVEQQLDTSKFVAQTGKARYNEFDLNDPKDVAALKAQGIDGTYYEENGSLNYVEFPDTSKAPTRAKMGRGKELVSTDEETRIEESSENDAVTDARALIDTMGVHYYDEAITADIKEAIMGDLGTDTPERHFAVRTSTVGQETGSVIARRLYKMISKYVKDVKIYYLTDEDMNRFDPKAGAYYDANGDYIVMRESVQNDKDLLQHVLPHEVTHAAFLHALRENPKLTAQVEALLDITKKWALKNGLPGDAYGFTNIDEFMSEAFSNQQFQEFLAGVKLGFGDRVRLMGKDLNVTARGKIQTAFDWLKLKVAELYGSEVNTPTAFDAAMQLGESLLSVSEQSREAYYAKNPDQAARVAMERTPDEEGEALSKAAAAAAKAAPGSEAAKKAQQKRDAFFAAKKAEAAKVAADKKAAADAAAVTPEGNKAADAVGDATEEAAKAPASKPTTEMVKKLRKLGLNDRQAKEAAGILTKEFGGATDETLQDIVNQIKKTVEEAKAKAKAAQTMATATGDNIGKSIEQMVEKMDGMITPANSAGLASRPVLKLMKLTQIARMADRWFGSENNPVRKISDLLNSNTVIKRRYMRELSDKLEGFKEAIEKHTPEQIKEFFSLAHDTTMAQVHPDIPLADQKHLGKDALKGMWSKAQHTDLAARFNALPEELQDLYIKTQETLAGAENLKRQKIMQNILTMAGYTDKAMADRFFEGKETEADIAIVGETLAAHLKQANDFKRLPGPYFNLARRGNWVVQGYLRITPPGNGKALPSEIAGNPPNVFEFATRQEAIDYAQSPDLTGIKADIKTGWRDKKTGKTYFGDEDGQVKVSKKDADAEQFFQVIVQNKHVEFVETKAQARALRKELETSGMKMMDVEEKIYQRDAANADMLSDQYRALMKTIEERKGTSKLTPTAQAEMIGILNEASLRFLGSTRIQSSRLPRRYVRGASQDLVRNTYEYINETAGYLAKLDTQPGIEAAMKELDGATTALSRRNKGFGTGASVIRNEINQRVLNRDYGDGNGVIDRIISRVKSLTFMMRLGSVGFSIVNSTQPLMITGPVLSGEFNPASASYHLTKAYNDVSAFSTAFKGVTGTVKAFAGQNSRPDTQIERVISGLKEPREREMMRRMADLNLLGEDADIGLEDLARRPEGKLKYMGMSIDYLEGIMRVMPQAVETINRSVSALSAYRLMYGRTGDHQKSMQYAADIVDATQGNNSAVNSAPIFNTKLGRVVLQFKKFAQNMVVLMANNVRRSVMGGAPGERRKGITTLAYLLVATQLAAGSAGLPWEPLKLALMAARALGLTDADMDDWDRAIEGWYKYMTGSDKAAEALTFGVTRALPGGWDFDMNSRLGMNSLVSFGDPRSSKEADVKSWLFDTVLGANAGTIYDIASGVGKVMSGDIVGGIATGAPIKFVADAAKAFQKAETPQELLLKTFGLNPGRNARESTAGRYEAGDKAKAQNEEYSLRDAYVAARGPAAIAKIKGRIREHNSKLPKGSPYRIDFGPDSALEAKRLKEARG